LNWEFWERYDLEMLAACEELWVLKLAGCQQSRGVNAEIAAAKTLGKPVRFVEAQQYGIRSEIGSDGQTLEPKPLAAQS